MNNVPRLDIFERAPEILIASLQNEAIVMHQENGNCYNLDGVSTRVYELLETPMNLEQLCAMLCREYDVDPETCRVEVAGLLDELVKEGLLLRKVGARA